MNSWLNARAMADTSMTRRMVASLTFSFSTTGGRILRMSHCDAIV